MDRLERIADLMASGKTTIPQHLRGSKGDCFAITLQSMQWGMNPFSVAQKTHLVNGTLGYEAQLVAAVINTSGAVKDRFHFEWFGPWDKVIGKFQIKKGDKGEYRVPGWALADEEGCGMKVWATLKGETAPRVLELLLAQARTRNSTLWADDPKQQLAYLAQKRWARLYAPDVILGVYSADELTEPGERFMGMADVVHGSTGPQDPAANAAPTAYPQDQFDKNLPQWTQVLAGGRKTHAEMIEFIETKGMPLTDEQKAKLRTLPAPKGQVTDAAPKVTYAQVADKLTAASTPDELAEAGSLIAAVADDQQRAELTAIYERRGAELA